MMQDQFYEMVDGEYAHFVRLDDELNTVILNRCQHELMFNRCQAGFMLN
jgi:hypothetical protein